MSLKKYREKRDFTKTTEPAGELAGGGGSGCFVVQKHQARNLHYDFRLEMEGVLKSWAVPKGPPLEPGVRRLAVQVEDHPMDYAKFEGSIPSGQYGGGDVMIWDKGSFTTIHQDENSWKFRIKGSKLNGTFALVQTGGNKWLLRRSKDADKD